MAGFELGGKRVAVRSSKPLSYSEESDPINVLHDSPFVHVHASTSELSSYYINSADAQLDIRFTGSEGSSSSVYVDVGKESSISLSGGSSRVPNWSCAIRRESVPTCDSLPQRVEILTSTGYVIDSNGVRPCIDGCFERMRGSLGRYYSSDHLINGLHGIIENPDIVVDKKLHALKKLSEVRAVESIPFLLRYLDRERDTRVLCASILCLSAIYAGLINFDPSVEEKYGDNLRSRFHSIGESSKEAAVRGAARKALAMVFSGTKQLKEDIEHARSHAGPLPYEVIQRRLVGQDVSLQIEAIHELGRLKEKRAMTILMRIAGGEYSLPQDLREVALSELAAFPFGEAANFLIGLLEREEPNSEKVHGIALALCQVPDFLRTAGRIAKIYGFRNRHLSESEMILISWGISLETPISGDVVTSYGAIPFPPSHPVSLEWLASQIDEMRENHIRAHRHLGVGHEDYVSVREVVGLQGILYPMYILLKGLQTQELCSRIGEWLERDYSDRLTEYGFVFRNDDHKVKIAVLSPAEWGSDYSHRPSLAMRKMVEEKGVLFGGHFHSLPGSFRFALPSGAGRVCEGDMSSYSQILITRLDPGEFNVKWYDHQMGVLNLGNYVYTR